MKVEHAATTLLQRGAALGGGLKVARSTLTRGALTSVLAALSAVAPAFAAEPWQDSLHLPLPTDLTCCWQQEQTVQIAAPGRAIAGSATVRLSDDGLTVTVKDYEGQTVATVVQAPGGEIVGPDNDSWSPALDQLLLMGVYLHHLDPGQWLASQPGWSLDRDGGRISVLYRDELQARLDYRDPPQAGKAQAFSLAIEGYALNLQVVASPQP